jgi:hypothetical protein
MNADAAMEILDGGAKFVFSDKALRIFFRIKNASLLGSVGALL